MAFIKKFTIMIAFALWGSAHHVPAATHDHETTSTIVLGYYPCWKSGLEPEQIRYQQFTHICHAFVTADTSGTIKTEGNLPSRELVKRAHATNTKVLLSLGGMDSGKYFGPMVQDKAVSKRFVTAVADMVHEYGYDGIDLDWEFPKGAEERDGFTELARQFRQVLREKNPHALITSALSGSPWAAKWVDGESLLEHMDFISIMTYDMHGPWDNHAGFNSALEYVPGDHEACKNTSVVGQMALWTDQMKWPKSRLLVGIPCYGRGFVADQWFTSTQYKDPVIHKYLPFRDVQGLLDKGWKRTWNQHAQAPWLKKDGTREIITYDDEQSAAAKGTWAGRNGYAGVFFWEISQDFTGGRHALAEAASQAFSEARKNSVLGAVNN